MIRAAVLVTALLVSAIATAENLQLVEDAANGTRLLVDTDSVKITPYSKNSKGDSIAVSARMVYYGPNNDIVEFVTGVDAEDCLTKNGGTIVNVYPDRSQSSYFWSASGSKLYDAQGQWLCMVFLKAADTPVSQPKSKSKSKKEPKKYEI